MRPTNEVIYYDFDGFRLDVRGERLLKDGRPVTLTHKAFLTLLILVRNAGRIVEKEEIISEIWGDSFVEESNLSQYVYVLRKILGSDPSGNPYIETVTRRGFRFTADVKEISVKTEVKQEVLEPPDPPPADDLRSPESRADETLAAADISGHADQRAAAAVVVEGENSADIPLADSQERNLPAQKLPRKNDQLRRRLRFLMIAILSLGIISAGVYVYKNRQPAAPVTAGNSTIRSIAVLPFKTIGEESSNEKLGLGMADAIITRLNKLKRIQVRSTSAVIGFTDQPPTDASRVGAELGVDAILEGTVQRDAGRVRVSVQLTKVSDGKSLWAESFDEAFTDIFTLQDTISAKVAESLELNLTREQELDLAQHATKNPAAFQAYQLGIYFWNKRSKDSLQKALEYFRQAIDLDPNYAKAHAGLADTYNMLGYYKFENEREMNEKARAAAEKALSLDNNLAEAHMAMSYVQQYGPGSDLNLSARSLERAVELSPYNSNVRVRYAWLKLSQNNLDEGLRQARLAQEYDPLSHVSNNVLCGFLSFQHKFDEAIPFCEKAISITPNAPRNRLVLAKVYFFNGRQKDALVQLQIQIDSSGGIDRDEAMGLLSYFYAKSGRQSEAQKIMDALKAKLEEQPSLYNYLTLTAYALGKKEEALRHFKKSIELQQISGDVLRYRFDPLWAEVRADKDFSLSGSSL